MVLRFLDHLLRSRTRYGVHSPFVYEFVTQVLPYQGSDWGQRIDAIRRERRGSEKVFEINDLGAGYGGKHQAIIRKTEAQVIRSSARKRRSGELLHRICRWHGPGLGIELGTNLGYSTAYQAAGMEGGKLISIEGASELSGRAGEMLDELGLEVDLRVGDFEHQLQEIKVSEMEFHYALMDGNHQYEATILYFDQLVSMMGPNGLIIVDDINWSAGMRQAWKEIKSRKEVNVTIDLFFLGLCFVHRPQARQDFRFRFLP